MTSLAKLIDIIDTRAGEIEIAYQDADQRKNLYARVKGREAAYSKLMEDLAREHRANHREANTHILTLAGIRVSCTAGISGLITAWLRKARAQVEAESSEQAKAGAA